MYSIFTICRNILKYVSLRKHTTVIDNIWFILVKLGNFVGFHCVFENLYIVCSLYLYDDPFKLLISCCMLPGFPGRRIFIRLCLFLNNLPYPFSQINQFHLPLIPVSSRARHAHLSESSYARRKSRQLTFCIDINITCLWWSLQIFIILLLSDHRIILNLNIFNWNFTFSNVSV